MSRLFDTLPETNIAPETLGSQNEFPFGEGILAGAMLVSGRVDTSQSSSVDQGSWPGMHDKNYLLGLRWLSGVALPHCHSDGTASTSSQWKRRKRIAEEGLTAVQQLMWRFNQNF